MKSLLLVLVFGVVLSLATNSLSDVRRKFSDFQHQYKKTYPAEEFQYRFNVFKANLDRYEADNKKAGSNIFGVTKFSDLTPEEFRRAYLMPKAVHENFKVPADKVAPKLPPAVNLPSKFDWNTKGNVITPVYNQEQCGSCWAFSATETIESYCSLGGKGLQSLAMQQVVDCDTTAYGCEGGWTYAAYEYVQSVGGIEYYKDYPYTGESESCSFNKADIFQNITGWGYVTPEGGSEDDMANWLVNKGPLSVCVDASSWSGYEAGTVMMANACGDSVDHCVQVTGLDVQQGTPVWNVRNSWGNDWGNEGYIWVQRGENACDITSAVTYVTC